jgi:hypothetical protein
MLADRGSDSTHLYVVITIFVCRSQYKCGKKNKRQWEEPIA